MNCAVNNVCRIILVCNNGKAEENGQCGHINEIHQN